MAFTKQAQTFGKNSFCLTGLIECVNLLQIYAFSIVMYKLRFTKGGFFKKDGKGVR